MTQIVTFDFLYIPDPVKSRALFNAKLFFGVPDTDPELEQNRVPVFAVQENGTLVPIEQPVLTNSGGVPVYNGSVVRLAIENNYSLKILDSNDQQKYYFEDSKLFGSRERITESIVLSDGQLQVDFQQVTTDASFYICGLNADNGRLCDEDYEAVSDSTIILTSSYPGGTVIQGVLNDETEDPTSTAKLFREKIDVVGGETVLTTTQQWTQIIVLIDNQVLFETNGDYVPDPENKQVTLAQPIVPGQVVEVWLNGVAVTDTELTKGYVLLTDFKTGGNTWLDALNSACSTNYGVIFPDDTVVDVDDTFTLAGSAECREWLLNSTTLNFNAEATIDTSSFRIIGDGATIFMATRPTGANTGYLTFTANCLAIDISGVNFKGDLRIAELANDAVGPVGTLDLVDASSFETGLHVNSSWNNNLLPNSPSLIPAPNTGDENFLNFATDITSNVVTLTYDIAALTIPAGAYIFQNGRFDRDFIRILGSGNYRFTDCDFDLSPSYMVAVRDDTQQARVFFTNIVCTNYAIDGFVAKCFQWEMNSCYFGKQFDVSKQLVVAQMPKEGHLIIADSQILRGNADADIFVFASATFPKITLRDNQFDGTSKQNVADGVYNSPAPTNGNVVSVSNCLHPFVTSSDGLIPEQYDGGAFVAKGCKFFGYSRAIFSTTFVAKDTFSFESCTIEDCFLSCTPTYFNVTDLENSSFGKVNIRDCTVQCRTFSLNAIFPINVNYFNCDISVDNTDPAVVVDEGPCRLEYVNLVDCTLSGWWTVLANSNVICDNVGLLPKVGDNPTTLTISDPFFDYENSLIIKGYDATTIDSFVPIESYLASNADGSNFSPNSPFFLDFKVDNSNVRYTYSNEFFGSVQAGVNNGNERYRANLYAERVEYPPIPTKGALSLYVPLNSLLRTNIDNQNLIVKNRQRAIAAVNSVANVNVVEFTLQNSGFAAQVATGDYVGFYYDTFDTVYWYIITNINSVVSETVNATVERFPTSGSPGNGLFQDVDIGDEGYWFSVGQVVADTPVITLQPVGGQLSGGTYTFDTEASNFTSVEWYLDNVLQPAFNGQQDPTVSTAGNWRCRYINANGFTDSVTVTVSAASFTLGDPSSFVSLSSDLPTPILEIYAQSDKGLTLLGSQLTTSLSKSTNASNFNEISSPIDPEYSVYGLDGTDSGDRQYLGGASAIWYSVTAGASWFAATGIPFLGQDDIIVRLASDGTGARVLATPNKVSGYSNNGRLYLSTDNGQTYGLHANAPFSGFGNEDIFIAKGNNNKVFVTSADSSGEIKYSNDGAVTFLSPTTPPSNTGKIFRVVSDTTGNTVYCGGANGGLFKSTDGGDTWSTIAGGLTASGVRALYCSSDGVIVIAGTADGSYLWSTNSGGSFTITNSFMPARIRGMFINPADDLLYVGDDNGNLKKSEL